MQKSRTPQCRIFWILVITASLTFTAMNLYQASESFINDSFHVALLRQDVNHSLYPPLKVCFVNWISWANLTAAEELNFTKDEFIFAMSYLTHIFAEAPFNENEIEKSFESKLFAKNLSIEQFYVSIAYRNKKIIEDLPIYEQGFNISLEDYPKSNAVPLNYWLCYQFSEDWVFSHIQYLKANETVYHASLDGILLKLNLSEFVTENRIPAYVKKFDYLAHVYPVAYSKDRIIKGNLATYSIVSSEAFSWINNIDNPCVEGRRWISSNQTCSEDCRRTLEMQLKEEILKRNFNSKIIRTMRNKIFFGKWNESEIEKAWKKASDLNSDELSDEDKVAAIPKQVQVQYDDCMKNCKLHTGCEEWSYSFTSGIMAGPWGMYTISYQSNVAVMKEVNLQTWENFTSNIGGLLGIWTGASILTIFQIVYLCCSKVRTYHSKAKNTTPQQNNGMQETIFSSHVRQQSEEPFVPIPHLPADIQHVPLYP